MRDRILQLRNDFVNSVRKAPAQHAAAAAVAGLILIGLPAKYNNAQLIIDSAKACAQTQHLSTHEKPLHCLPSGLQIIEAFKRSTLEQLLEEHVMEPIVATTLLPLLEAMDIEPDSKPKDPAPEQP